MKKQTQAPDKLEAFNLKFEKFKKEFWLEHARRMSILEGKPHICKILINNERS